ncbi:MAG: type II secretion system protein M [Oceanospirillaceae bacterium]|nr:type II secretion system protein M [Oceanospirillaceae bacterium]
MPIINTKSSLHLALPWLLLMCLSLAAAMLWQDKVALEETLTSSQQELSQISDLSRQYQSLGGAANANRQAFIAVNEAKNWLVSSGKQQGLNISVDVVKATQSGKDINQLNVRFKQAHFNRLIEWVQQQNHTNLSLIASQLTASGVGKTDGFLMFEVH